MDIKGLGPATVTKLNIDKVPDLYKLSGDDIKKALNSEKTGDKVYQEIQKSLNCKLENLLQGFGVPLFGNSASKKLADEVYDELKDLANSFDIVITYPVCKKAGLGDKVSQNMADFMTLGYREEEWDKVPFTFTAEKMRTTSGPVVCITGKLTSYSTKAEAEKVLLARGYQVSSSLTKAVSILINESGIESQKTLQAAERGVQIVNNLKIFLGE